MGQWKTSQSPSFNGVESSPGLSPDFLLRHGEAEDFKGGAEVELGDFAEELIAAGGENLGRHGFYSRGTAREFQAEA